MSSDQPKLLNGLTPADASAVLALGRRISLGAGAVLFSLGDPAEHLYLIVRGRVALTLPMQLLGHEKDVLAEERVAGETVGWSALIPPHRFTLKATSPMESEVLALPRTALVEHFGAQPTVGYTVTRNVAELMGQRLQVFQAMWLREMQRMVEFRSA